MSGKIAITTVEMQSFVKKAMEECFPKFPEKYVEIFNIRLAWTYGRMNGREVLRILQDKYEWEGDIPTVRQSTVIEKIYKNSPEWFN